MKELHVTIQQLNEQMAGLLNQPFDSEVSDIVTFIEGTLTLEVIADLKAVIDAVRKLLWIYIEAASRAADGNINDSFHGPRLRAATELLRSLREEAGSTARNFRESRSFIEHVETLLAYYSHRPLDQKL